MWEKMLKYEFYGWADTLNYEDNPEQFREVYFTKEEKRLRYEYLKGELEKRLSDRH